MLPWFARTACFNGSVCLKLVFLAEFGIKFQKSNQSSLMNFRQGAGAAGFTTILDATAFEFRSFDGRQPNSGRKNSTSSFRYPSPVIACCFRSRPPKSVFFWTLLSAQVESRFREFHWFFWPPVFGKVLHLVAYAQFSRLVAI